MTKSVSCNSQFLLTRKVYMENILILIAVVAGLAIGGVMGAFIKKLTSQQALDSATHKAQQILTQAKDKQQEILLTAKDKAIKMIDEAKKEEDNRRREISRLQERLEKREETFDKKILELENRQEDLNKKSVQLDEAKQELVNVRNQQLEKLEKIAQLTQDDAKKILLENVERRSHEDLISRERKLQQITTEELEQKANKVLAEVIQRCASSHASETTTTTVTLPNEEMKGRIIGREGRNIRSIEQLTGTEIIVDETPDTILVSGFSPIRRHLAKRVLDKLLSDGRIHPGRIEEVVALAKKEMAIDIKKAGEEAMSAVGVVGVDPKLVQILGRLKYRTSYGQNQLQHAVEVTNLAKLLAEELKADMNIVKRGALFHDIGKAVDHEIQGPHTQIGYDIMKKFGEPEDIAYICIGHHEDVPRTLEAVIVKTADAISGARPGARKDSYENYLQRLTELEAVANTFEGVDKCYAIQAGREIRIFVKPENVDDYKATKLARDIADKVEQELKYPGEIKITVIREKRVIEYAR